MESHQWLLLAVSIWVLYFQKGWEERPLCFTVIIIIANAICTDIHWHFFGDGHQSPLFNIALDLISGLLVLYGPCRMIKILVGFTFAAQIGSHTAYAQYPFEEQLYWNILNAMFIFQIFLLACWGEGHGQQLHRLFNWLFGRLAPAAPYTQSMATNQNQEGPQK